MKTKFNFLFWLLALVPLALVSCDDDETIAMETTLETSVANVTFNKDGGDQAVTVTTDATKWVATSPVEGQWLTLTVNGDQLSVKAAANTQGADRKSYILINAGSASAKVEVMQSAGDDAVFLTPETLTFGKGAAEQRVDVIGAKDFTVAPDADWITVDYKAGADFFTVSVAAATEAREGKVIVTAGTTVKELIVKQGSADKFILPVMLETGTDYNSVFKAEMERGHVLSNVPQMFGNSYYEFATGNPDFPMTGYWYNVATQDAVYSQGAVLSPNAALFEEDKGKAFKTFMEEKGFTYSEAEKVFKKEGLPYVVNYQIQDGVVQINAIYQPVDTEQKPSFTQVPLTVQREWLSCVKENFKGKDLDFVAAWEKDNGGTYNAEESVTDDPQNSYSAYDVKDGAESLIRRGYWDVLGNPDYAKLLEAAQEIYTDLTRVYFTDPVTGGLYESTKFLQLLADNGFTYLGSNEDGYKFYSNEEFQLAYIAFEMNPGEQVIQFQAMRLAAPPATSSILLDVNVRAQFLQRVIDAFGRLDDGIEKVPLR